MSRGVLRVLSPVVVLVAVAVSWSAVTSSTHADENYPTIDGQFSGTGPVAGGTSVNLQVTGRGGVPATGVGAVAINVAVTNPTAASFLTVYPAGAPRPTAANLNFTGGQTVPNLVVVKVGDNGQISLFNYAGTVDVVADVQGWFPTGAAFTGLNPARLLDTRPGFPTIDGNFTGVGPVSTILDLEVTGRGGVPAGGVGAVVLNVAVANPTASSFLTVFPTGSIRPTAANLNYVAGQVVPNLVVVKVGDSGFVSLYNYAGRTDLVVDVLGWFPSVGSFVGVVPARLMDTRAGSPTIDAAFAGDGALGPSTTRNLTVVGRTDVPADAAAVALNVAVTHPTATSFLTVWPAGEARPTAANLNFTGSQTVPNMVIVKVGAGGQISLFNLFGNVDVVVDVLGWFPANGSFNGLTPARLMDSRRTPVAPPVTTSPPPVTSPPATTSPPPPQSYAPGSYFVNTQFAPGRYVANATAGCYWERKSGFGGTSADRIANDFRGFAGRVIVDVKTTDAGFEFDTECGRMTAYTPTGALATAILAGSHIVGDHLVAGTYSANASPGCYWERLTGFSGQSADRIANDFRSAAGPIIVTISSTDVGFSTDPDCGVWTKVG